jgi:hypothetical protein
MIGEYGGLRELGILDEQLLDEDWDEDKYEVWHTSLTFHSHCN